MTTFIFIAGLVAVAVGAGLIYMPAGLIVGGGMAAWAAYTQTKAGIVAPSEGDA